MLKATFRDKSIQTGEPAPTKPGRSTLKSKEKVPHKSGKQGDRRLKRKLNGLGNNRQKAKETPHGKRFPDRVVFGVAHEVKNGRVSNSAFIRRQIKKDAYLKANTKTSGIRAAHWHFMGGPRSVSKSVLKDLKANGISYSFGSSWKGWSPQTIPTRNDPKGK